MKPAKAASELQNSAALVQQFVTQRSDDDLIRRPAPDKWAAVEVVGHLLLEERQDFRLRMRMLIDQPGVEFPPLNVDGAVRNANFLTQKPAKVLAEFLNERSQSISWLQSLEQSVLQLYAEHPQAGRLHVGDLLAAWVAHDILHLRQLLSIDYQRIESAAKPFGIAYAGGW